MPTNPPKAPAKRLFDFDIQVTAESYDEAHMVISDALGNNPNVDIQSGQENYSSKDKTEKAKLGIKGGKSDMTSPG
jgi:hypothetical protein